MHLIEIQMFGGKIVGEEKLAGSKINSMLLLLFKYRSVCNLGEAGCSAHNQFGFDYLDNYHLNCRELCATFCRQLYFSPFAVCGRPIIRHNCLWRIEMRGNWFPVEGVV